MRKYRNLRGAQGGICASEAGGAAGKLRSARRGKSRKRFRLEEKSETAATHQGGEDFGEWPRVFGQHTKTQGASLACTARRALQGARGQSFRVAVETRWPSRQSLLRLDALQRGLAFLFKSGISSAFSLRADLNFPQRHCSGRAYSALCAGNISIFLITDGDVRTDFVADHPGQQSAANIVLEISQFIPGQLPFSSSSCSRLFCVRIASSLFDQFRLDVHAISLRAAQQRLVN